MTLDDKDLHKVEFTYVWRELYEHSFKWLKQQGNVPDDKRNFYF